MYSDIFSFDFTIQVFSEIKLAKGNYLIHSFSLVVQKAKQQSLL